MKITKFAVVKPVATLMLFITLFIIGIVSFAKLPIDFMPKIEPPVISVLTFWSGSSTEDVENKVTKVIENDLSIINNIKEIKSTTKEGLSIVNCVFDQDTDLNEAANDIRDGLEFAKAYMPEDVADPILFKFNTAMMPIVFYGITAKESWENLYDIADDELARPLKRLAGVGAVQVIGGMQRQINIKLDREKLASYDLSVFDIEKALQTQNISLPVGLMNISEIEYLIRIPSEYQTQEEIENVVVKKGNNNIVRLSDVAFVEDSFKEQKYNVKIDGRDGIMLMVQKRAEANTAKVASLVHEEMKMLKNKLPIDVKAKPIMDSSEFIHLAVSNLRTTAFWAIFFVGLITYFFFRSIKLSSIIILTIPFSVIIAFIFMYSQDWTINVMSLAAITIAIGMVVDNSVVVLDNVAVHIKNKQDIKNASINAAKEVGLAIGASTLTTVVVFLPLLFVKGIVGTMFKQLGGVVTITLLASLLCALMLAPMLLVFFIKKKSEITTKKQKFFKKVEDYYLHILSYALHNRKKIIFSAVSLFIVSLFLFPFIGSEFMPKEDSGDIIVNVQLPIGTCVETTTKLCHEIEQEATKIIGEKYILHSYFRCGAQDSGIGVAFNRKEGAHIGEIGFKLVKQKYRKFATQDVASKISDKLKTYDNIKKLEIDASNPMSKHMFGESKQISIEILGYDLLETEKIAKKVKDLSQTVEGAKDVIITRDMGKPELIVKVDRQKAATFGLDVATVATTLRTLYHGKKTTNFHDKTNDFDIFMRLDSNQRKSLDDILYSEIKTPYSKSVYLYNIANIEERLGPVEIERMNQQRVIKVEMDTYKKSQGEVVKQIQNKINKNVVLPKDVTINFGGLSKEKVKAFQNLMLMFLFGILLVYMVMAAQFESLKHPFIIMFSVPFALVGVFFALFISNTSLSAISFIGIVMLVGIVVNNAIVLIDYINKLREKNKDLKTAIVKACQARLRPVVITTLTTVFGMFALVISTGEGSEVWRPLGISVMGGLIASTIVTLVFIPTLYYIFENKKAKKV